MSKAFLELQSKSHEQVSIFQRPEIGLIAIIAVHDTTLGPSLGGCRMREYDSFDDAMFDALRLSEGMTYKNALAGLSIGGGKSVILADRDMREGRRELFLGFGECVESLGGTYITAEDMGTTVADVETIGERTTYVSGTDPDRGGGGDPSPYTAKGVFDGICACIEKLYGNRSLVGRSIAIQGVGAVGARLAALLAAQGATLFVADSRQAQCAEVAATYGATVVELEQIYDVQCDVFSPCAVGATINTDTIPRLNCKVVAGAANNQLATAEDEKRLAERSILYAPDFAINAGGVILCADESEEGGFTQSRVEQRVAQIGATVLKILTLSEQQGRLAGEVAVSLAKERIEKAKAA